MTATTRPAASALDAATAPFLLSIDLDAGRIAVRGDFDRRHVERFLAAVGLLRSSPSPDWSVDVSGVTFCDAGGLRGLLEAKHSAERTGRSFRVAGAGPWMSRLLPMIGLNPSAPRFLRAVP